MWYPCMEHHKKLTIDTSCTDVIGGVCVCVTMFTDHSCGHGHGMHTHTHTCNDVELPFTKY